MFGKKFYLLILLIILPLALLAIFPNISPLISYWRGEERKALVTSKRESLMNWECNRNEICSTLDLIVMVQTLDGSKTNVEIVVGEEVFLKIKEGDVITYHHLEGFEPALKGDRFGRAKLFIIALLLGMAFFIFSGVYFAKNERKIKKVWKTFIGTRKD